MEGRRSHPLYYFFGIGSDTICLAVCLYIRKSQALWLAISVALNATKNGRGLV